jgi:hypothetical protein
LLDDPSVRGRVHRWMERGFSKYFFIQNFCDGKSKRAQEMGISYRFQDKLATGVTILVILVSTNFYKFGTRIPLFKNLLDKQLVNKLSALLESYGHADFITDASEYKLQISK